MQKKDYEMHIWTTNSRGWQIENKIKYGNCQILKREDQGKPSNQ